MLDAARKAAAAKPSLHEIAAMPFPASMEAMRRHYNRDWHKPEPDGKTLITYEVTMGFCVPETRTYKVEAYSEEEAQALADDMLDKDRTIPSEAEDFEVVDVKVMG